MSDLPPHVQRMVEEGEQLADRVEKLGRFLVGPVYATLPEEEQTLMSAQCGAMTAYLQVLSLRIARAVSAHETADPAQREN